MAKASLTEIIKQIDPNLALIRRFLRAYTIVCLVGYGGSEYVLKLAPSRHEDRCSHLESERIALLKCRDIDEIPSLVKSYRTPEYEAILRQYVPGRWPNGLLSDAKYAQLRKIVKKVHTRGVANLDIANRRNIIIDRDGRVALIDLGFSKVQSSLDSETFETLKIIDRQNIMMYSPASL